MTENRPTKAEVARRCAPILAAMVAAYEQTQREQQDRPKDAA